MRSARKTATLLGGLAVVAALALAGCSPSTGSGDSSGPVSQADIDKAMNTPTTLTFWSWVPNLKNEVALFEKKYPKIKVNLQNVGSGADQYTKLRTALKAGKGAPDAVQIEYQYISSFRLTKSIEDLSKYGADKLGSQYVDWVWNQVSNDGVWGIPQDSGPLGNLYRSDIMQAAGVTEPPATWDDYAKDAEAVKSKTGSYISNLPGNDPGQMVGFFWQAGSKPFGYDGKKGVKIDLDNAADQKVVSYWNDLLQKDLVSNDADFNDNWYQGFNSGKYAGWPSPAWAPVFLAGSAKSTAGKWAAAKIPQWEAGQDVSGNWGGSSDAVLSSSQHKIAAYELVKFINSDQESTLKLANEQFLFPTLKSTLQDSSFVDQKSDFYGGQQVNKLFTGISDTVDVKFEWLPFMDYVYSSYNDTLGKAISDKTDLKKGLSDWQTAVVAYAKKQGFTVTQ